MLDNEGFDLWADEYDNAVEISDEENSYPFAGYKAVLNEIFETVMKNPGSVVLDLGFGTALLTSKLYENGFTIYGQDFSARMTELASLKMPEAHLYQGDLLQGPVKPLLEKEYDFIVSTYALHHLTYEQKVSLLHVLYGMLSENGKILIGDIAFETRSLMEQCQHDAGDEWDDEECYFVIDEMRKEFPDLTFRKLSFCAGVMTLERKRKCFF